MTQLSKRAEKLLARLKDGHYYPTFGPRVPKAMQELRAAGLVGTAGRPVVYVSCYVPKGYRSHREVYPK